VISYRVAFSILIFLDEAKIMAVEAKALNFESQSLSASLYSRDMPLLKAAHAPYARLT
jgi:hypothetical protein